jgi:hypothetical protein
MHAPAWIDRFDQFCRAMRPSGANAANLLSRTETNDDWIAHGRVITYTQND